MGFEWFFSVEKGAAPRIKKGVCGTIASIALSD
jgi:hypothetical protein